MEKKEITPTFSLTQRTKWASAFCGTGQRSAVSQVMLQSPAWTRILDFSVWMLFFSVISSASGVSIGTALLVISGIVVFRHELRLLPQMPLFWSVSMLIAALAISILFAEGSGFGKPLGKLRYLAFYFLIALYFARFPAVVEKMARVAVPLSVFFCLVCIFQFTGVFCPMVSLGLMPVELAPIIGSGARYFHARGLLYHHNPFAYTSLMLFCLMLGQLLTATDPKRKKFFSVGIVSILACIAMSGSRGSWVSLFFCLGTLGVVLGKRYWKPFAPVAGVTVVILVLLALPLGKRFNSIRPSQNMERFRLWEISWRLFEESPVVGHGYHYGFELNRWRHMTEEEKLNENFPTDPHSLYFDLLATTGLLGFGAFLFFLVSALMSYLRALKVPSLSPSRKATEITGLGALVVFAVGSAFDSHFFHVHTLMATVFYLGLGQSASFSQTLKLRA